MRKGQASTEYLIILAVVIIVALIVVGVMGWFPGISGAVTETESKQYWSGMASPLSVLDYKYSGTNLQVSMKNMGTDRLNLTAVKVATVDGTVTAVLFTAGETKAITIADVTDCGTAGTPFSVNLVMTYDNVESTLTGISETGTKPLVGKCS